MESSQKNKNKKRLRIVGRVFGISAGVILVLVVAFIARVLQVLRTYAREGYWFKEGLEQDENVIPTSWERFFGVTIETKTVARDSLRGYH